ncbi:hypothetical protein BaRGS_00020007, partial [Batillaria attramentaria]
LVFTDLKNKQLYTSSDDLKSNQTHPLPVSSDELIMHPTEPDKNATKPITRDAQIPNCNATGDEIDLQLGPFLPQTMLVANEYIFVQKTDWDGENSHVMVSHNRGEFKHAFFPANVKTKDFLMVNADGDTTGRFYTLCLKNIHHRATRNWFEVDLHEVRGLTGTYLVNQLDGPAKDGRKLKTLISVDKGGRWMPLEAECPDNKTDCKLVLRLDLDNFIMDWILSETNAPGIVIAHGHYGETYEHDLKNMSVFYSSDGARTWKKAPITGLFHFNILDQGGIITAIQNGDQGPTSTVHYSYDDGVNWPNEQFGQTLKVDGVLNEPGIHTLVVSVYGHVSVASPWTMVELNFSQVLSTQCTEDQYDQWTPSDEDNTVTEICILGQRVSYGQRKLGERCFNGENFTRTVLNSSCNCADEDFECDFGYRLDQSSSTSLTCKKETWYNDSFIALDCEAGKTFLRSQGYRKIAVDSCTGGVTDKYKSKNETCPLAVPRQLIVVSNVTVVATGDPVFFHLSQRLGSKKNTNYTWDFNDKHSVRVIGHKNASGQVHSFSAPGIYNITVTASNSKGSSVSDALKLRVEDPVHRVGLFTAWAAKTGFVLRMSATSNVVRQNAFGSLHYVWRFGDETGKQKGVLTWSPSTNHTYTKPGTYTLTVTVVNAVSALSKQMTIKVYDNAVVAQLSFSPNINALFAHLPSNPASHTWFLDSITQELSLRTGVNMDRLSVTLNSSIPVKTDVLVTPPPAGSPSDEMSAEQIVDVLKAMVGNKTLFLYQSVSSRLGDVQVTDIKKEGPNYRAVYITVPIVILAAIVTGLFLLYYRKRFRNMRRYTMVNQSEDTDALLDDDDEPPLDLIPDSRNEPRSRDDPMLDLGTGSHLVMVTGSGGGDNAENC